MFTVDDIKKIHPTALKVEQIKDNQIFLIFYPRLVLAVSYETLIAFNHHGGWHFCTEKGSTTTTKHQYHLLDMIEVKYWYTSRARLILALKTILDIITLQYLEIEIKEN